ncbi:MAG TPA: ComEC/Rec2 family competence protein, partial [Candidatus Saccharimonadales bacterium]|nr:ComEC/Rec2 family competence protein [Candidatus Saccharimonadales bacterium]
FAASVKSVARPNEAALGLGFVVGQRSSLPADLDNDLRMIGLTHIVVASGYNLTILVRFARRLLARWSRFLATGMSGVLMFGFALFSGFSASMNRAVLVTGLSLAAWHVGRRFHPLMLIIYASALTAYLNPNYIWGDVGWYLSFLAFGGVLIVAPLISKVILRADKPNSLAQVVIETLAAQIMTLPLILLIFGQLPNLAVVANALVAPVIPLSMLATTIAGLIGMLAPWLAGVAGLMMHFTVGYVLAVVDWLSSVPGAQSLISLPAAWLVLVYGSIIIASGLVWWLTRHDFLESSVVD